MMSNTWQCRIVVLLRLVLLVLLGSGAGTAAWAQGVPQLYPQPIVIDEGTWPSSVVTGIVEPTTRFDIGFCDALAAGVTPACHLLTGLANGTYTPYADYSLPGTTGSRLVIAPQGTTGSLEIVSATAAGFQVQYRFQGSNAAMTSVTFPALGTAAPVIGGATARGASGNSAGVLGDTAVTDLANGYVYVLRPNQAPFAMYQLAHGARDVQAADLNGDGINDLVVQGTDGVSVYLLLSNADGSLRAPVLLQPAHGARSFLLKDMDLDGKVDLIAEGANGAIDIYLGQGDGTFAAASSVGTGVADGRTGHGGHLVVAAYVDGDTIPDLVTATPAGISVLRGAGGLNFNLVGIYNLGPGRSSFAVQDFGTNYINLMADSPEGIAIVYGDSLTGSFSGNRAFAAGKPAMSGAVGSFTGSGNLDAVVSTGAVQSQVFLGAGDGSFLAVGGQATPMPTTASTGTAGYWGVVQAGDLNGDGLLDLAVTADGGSVAVNGGVLLPTTASAAASGLSVQYGKGDGTFQAPVNVTGALAATETAQTPQMFYGVSTALDLVGTEALIVNRDAEDYRYFGDYGQGVQSGTYGTQTTGGLHARDLVATGALRGTQPGAIDQQDGSLIEYGNVVSGTATALGDLAVVGSLTTPGQQVAPDIAASFPGVSQALGFRAFPGAAVVADLDGDGNGDLLVTYANLDANPRMPSASKPNYLYIWFGSGNGQFQATSKHPVNPMVLTLQRNYYQVAVADLNQDGIPDLILSDGYLIDVQFGVGDGTFANDEHFLAGQGINSIAAADLRHTGKLDLVVANGGAVLTNPVANLEVLGTNPDVDTGGITVLLNMPPTSVPPGGTLTASPEPAPFEAAYTLTATVPGPGTVVFSVDGTYVGTVTTATTTAVLPVPAVASGTGTPLLPGQRPLSAIWTAAASSVALQLTGRHTVELGATTVALTPSSMYPLASYYGTPADGTFAVTPQDSRYPTTGTYTLLDNGSPAAIYTDLPIAATCPYGNPVFLDPGKHSFSVEYNGGPQNGDPVNGTAISPAVLYTISPDLTVATLRSSVATAVVGTAVKFSVTVSGNVVTPVGTVTILDGGSAIGTATLAGGMATFSTALLSVGTHQLTAVYAGNIDFNPATSNPVTVVITPVPMQLPSMTLLVSNLNPAPVGVAVTFTATVLVSGPFVQYATGVVTFLDGSAVIGTGALNAAGVASFTTSTLAAGSHTITASYAGDNPTVAPGPISAGTLPSVSAVLTEVIAPVLGNVPPSFTLTVAPVPVTIGVGRTAVLLVSVAELGSFHQTVQLACTGLPTEVGCNFVTPLIPAGGAATTLQVSTAAPHDCGDPAHPYFLGSNGGTSGAVFAGLMLAGLGLLRKRRVARLLVICVGLLGGLVLMNGCGHCTDLGTRPGTYHFTVTAVAQGGSSEMHAQDVAMTVTIP